MSEPIPEKQFAERLNLARKTVAQLRAELLTEGEHFRREPGGMIVLTPAGAALLGEHLKKNGGGGPPGALEALTAAEPAAPVVRTFYVFKRVSNPHIVLACEDRERKTKPVTIRVKSNASYVTGQAIYATAGVGLVFNVFGRAPRWRGEKLRPPKEAQPELWQQQPTTEEPRP